MSELLFDHEKLDVYRFSIEFVNHIQILKDDLKLKNNLFDQLERASASIALNIAEGNGKYSPKDKCRYFDIARGSAFECDSCLDVLFARNIIDESKNQELKLSLKPIVAMLMGLIKSQSNRVYEEEIHYSP